MTTIISNIHGSGKTIINGKVYENFQGSMTITDEGIFVNGKPIEEYEKPSVIKIEITGCVESISSENSDVTVNGSAGSVTTKNGNVQVSNGVKGNVDTKNGNVIVGGGVGGDVTTKNGNITGSQILANSVQTCKDEQKPVEPKSNVSDWVVFNNHHDSVYQVEKIENYEYTLRHILGGSMPLSFSHEDMIRTWSIQDAKNGDVLACNEEILLFKSYSVQGRISLYCWYNGRTNNFHNKEVTDVTLTTRNKIYPATKEQRDALMKAMTDAGYTFDFGKKELKKIEHKPAECSEEDELSCFESALFTAFSDAWQSYLIGEKVNVKQWAKDQSKELLEAAKEELKGQKPAWSEEDEDYRHGEWRAYR